jgi:hypothetical protein
MAAFQFVSRTRFPSKYHLQEKTEMPIILGGNEAAHKNYPMTEDGYEKLADVLLRAYHQAARGKGKDRHAYENEPFDQQMMQDMAKRFGTGALLAQAFKKSEESQRLPVERGVNELLGAIVYLAGAVIAREKQGGVA